jgi:two-component system chemotaxis response regulator CheB
VSPREAGRPVRVVVADDSSTARRLLVELCERDPDIVVVGEASNGEQAVELTLRLGPSLVLMDVHMPVLNGIEATKEIMRERPTPIVMVTAVESTAGVEAGLSALRFGALTVLSKPGGPATDGYEVAAARLTSLVKALADVKVIRRRDRGEVPPPRRPTFTPAVLAVAASTGGPPAVSCFLQALPADLPVPIVVVQHIVEGFLPGLITWLRSEVPFHVTQAEHGQPLEPGTVYVAPDGHHLEVDRQVRAVLTDAAPVSGFRPSASVLFGSLARNLGPAGTAVVLTGMGQDGLEGARALRAAGGKVLAQDEPSSVVYGMPKAVADAGLAQVQGTVEDLAAEIAGMWRK